MLNYLKNIKIPKIVLGICFFLGMGMVIFGFLDIVLGMGDFWIFGLEFGSG